MPKDIEKIWIFRIVHINNVEYILQKGLFTKNHKEADPNYIDIGDTILIGQRNDLEVPINPPGGNLGEYITFYFGPLSPMLLNIKTGYRGITQRPQSEIVYICCKFTAVKQFCTYWCFTNGHAKNRLTRFFNDEDDLDHVDWHIVGDQYWRNTDEDPDRIRRKQAEFLIKTHVPVECFGCIVVYNKERQEYVQQLTERLNLNIKVLVKPEYYYK